MYQSYTWRGEPILDIEKFAHDRDERMVCVHQKIREPTIGGGYIYYEEDNVYPEKSFYNCMMKRVDTMREVLEEKITYRDPILK